MSKLFTLTVPDVLWINLQLTGEPQSFDYAKLEEATFYQYSAGDSRNLAHQAARFLKGFHKMSPLAKGNEATAFVGMLAFLRMNSASLTLTDAEALPWAQSIWSGKVDATAAVAERITTEDHHAGLVPPSEEIVGGVMEEYAETCKALSGPAVSV